ncbi:MAG: hypothetical protein CMF29_08180 [Kiritimatiellaceae bacterium]|nr:hypothetical protein [Kiritimatiellaceae bacterium]OUW96997.1 MAG: hypothetical protein CBD88_03175 [Flavobacteriales bacterium TMED228]
MNRLNKIIKHASKGVNANYMSVVHGHTKRYDDPARQRERMFQQMSRDQIKSYWLRQLDENS